MNIISSDLRTKYVNSATCTAYEYEFGEETINCAVIELTGRYPGSGYAVNEVCTEIIYVIEGKGSIHGTSNETELRPGDMVKIPPNDTYFFDGTMKILISSAPAWYPEQYKVVNA